jgi:hypothetical protein
LCLAKITVGCKIKCVYFYFKPNKKLRC